MTQSKCLELAVVTVKDAVAMDAIQKKVHETVAGYPGYVQSIALRSIKDPQLRADVVLWASEKAAKDAAKMFETDDRMKTCMAAIEEIKYFSHFTPRSETNLNDFVKFPVVEIAAVKPKEGVALAPLQETLHKELGRVEGAEVSLAGTQAESPDLLDVIAWTGKEAHHNAPTTIQENAPELGAFFTGIETMHVFDLFETIS